MKMYNRYLIVGVLLHCSAVFWCGAMHLPIDRGSRVRFPDNEVASDVKNDIRNIIHTGIYSHLHLDPARAEVVTPVRVSREGEFISRTLSHSHEHGHARARRSLNSKEHTVDHMLHYNITVDGRNLRLDLRPSVSFMTPSMVIERHAGDHRTRSVPAAHATACHYTGSVRGQPASRVALSACDGLAGLLRTEHGEYWIEPSNQLPTDESEGRSHVIFKRSALSKEDAWHRARQAQNSKTESTSNSGRLNRREMNQNRYNEYKRKRIEDLRRNSSLYNRQQAMKRRFDQRRKITKFNRTLNSLSYENVQRLPSNPLSATANTAAGSASKPQEKRHKGQKNNARPRRRRRRKAKECATKQPPYPWKNKNSGRGFDASEVKELRHNKTHRRYPHHHQLSQRNDFYENRRSPRSVSKPQHVEVLLVADTSMTDFHDSKGSLETYLLTIMNMVSSLYMDPSIGNYIKVVVVKIILVVDSASPDLVVSSNADHTLSSFCRWQQKQNPDDDDNPHHHDVAILVTRQDICSRHDAPCSTLGVAHVAGMCKPDRSCSVNEDNGITLAHTITHELGHNFGLYHDTEKIGCHRREGTTLHIMTPIFEADTVEVAWSRCSKRDVTNFLDAGLGECLGDQPSQEEYVYPEQPAGVMFDAATQCHLQFGAEAAVCAEPSELCQHLWCLVNGTCKTMLRPAAPGTSCGPDMWCQGQSCVARAPAPRPRDGGWGAWGAWSACSRSCGAGVSTQTRACDSPQPEHNGKYCIGERSRYKICNTDPCPVSEMSFREIQCSKFKNQKINNETIEKWIPYFDQDRPCELSCIAQERNDLELNDGFVADGTPCRQSLGARDLCIAGVCHKVGCDWIVDSEVEEDACGVCGGDGSACKTVQGIYNKGTTKQTGFSEVAVIPAGSRNVKIQEKVNPGNYISIGSAKTKKVYLSGKRYDSSNATLTEYLVAGSPAIYERDRDWEKVRIPGPIIEDIKVYQRIYRGRHRNPGVTYQYTVDRQPNRRRWRLSEWSPCSASCGIGYSRQRLVCIDDNDQIVEEAQCYNIESPQHAQSMKQCRIAACPTTAAPPRPAHWWLSPWSTCSPACNMPGRGAVKQRNVYCVDNETNSVIEEYHCNHTRKPDRSMLCANLPPC